MMYKILFVDGESWEGGKPENSKWNEMPNKPISELQYYICNKTIILKGYEAYNHLFHRPYFLLTKEVITTQVIIMGLYKNNVTRFIIDFKKNTFYRDEVSMGIEWKDSKVTGWKKGIDNLIPSYKII